ncbi:glycosyltransferase [Cryomorpha ignava]|uniref:Glycosyltransferase n=1 Tax=Cryomorpha ignava TaxID=101383 RepID=A0A7K3WVN4_9FLAO|nr:glycosyltransferase family 2 protein [Cryomorpha ignava]NEN25730.1 glycosyltransferase [Cryomorpha ignava]
MNDKFFISIITVAYNSAATIGRTLESLRQQTDKSFESIVIDGGSKDATMEIVKSFSDVVSKSISEPDKGIYDAMNKGIALAEGKYVAFLNSDDAYFPDTVASVIAFAEEQNPDIIYGNMQKERQLGKELFTRIEKPNLQKMPETMGVFHPATFAKKELFERLGGYDLRFRLAADYHWFLRAYIEKADFRYLDKVLVKFSVGGVSNFSCESYREGIIIQEELNTGYADKMRVLYEKCRRKRIKQQIIAKFVRLPIIKRLYLKKLKKRWN